MSMQQSSGTQVILFIYLLENILREKTQTQDLVFNSLTEKKLQYKYLPTCLNDYKNPDSPIPQHKLPVTKARL